MVYPKYRGNLHVILDKELILALLKLGKKELIGITTRLVFLGVV